MTRYPRSGKGKKWTALELRAIPIAWKGDTLSDGDGLTGEVRVASDGAVSVRWRYAFKDAGKVRWAQCGTWPAITMENVRQTRDRARDVVRSGVNPIDQKKAERIEAQARVAAVLAQAERERVEQLPLSALFDTWLANGVARADGNAELRRTFEKDLLPTLGNIPVRAVTDEHLRDALRVVGRGRGRGRTAERMLSELRQMFRWAEKRQPWRGLLIGGNPAELVDLKLVVPKGYETGIRSRTLSPAEIRELRDAFARMNDAYENAPDKRAATRPVQRETQLAMWICLSVACRIGELLQARWEDVDLVAGEWRVPKENTKTGVEWRVYLSDFARRQFQALKDITGKSEWCFPARHLEGHVCLKSVSKQIGDRQIMFKDRKPLQHRRHDDSLVLAGGENGEWTPHDLRRTASTMMQQLGVSADVIDRCQNHVLPGSRVRRHYLHHDFADEKRAAWRLLGDRLDAIMAANDVVSIQRSNTAA